MSRHPRDCYITPPCAAFALRQLLNVHGQPRAVYHDPFAGPGTLLEWGTPAGSTRTAMEIDPHWCDELAARVDDYTIDDALAGPWLGNGAAIVTNPPYSYTEQAIAMAVEHSRRHDVLAALLLRTDYFQHPGRPAPDALALLRWRPRFSGALNAKGELQLGSDYAGYVWAFWLPKTVRRDGIPPLPRLSWIDRPPVGEADRATHRKLALQAHQNARSTQ